MAKRRAKKLGNRVVGHRLERQNLNDKQKNEINYD